MSNYPPEIEHSIGEDSPAGVFSWSKDPTKYIVGRSRFERPKLRIPDGPFFEWPGGIEGVRISGQVGVVQHSYIGDNALVVRVMHSDARRIEMQGQFPGLTGQANVRDLIEIIVADTPPNGKLLILPGVFPKEQNVTVENYDFNHPQENRDDSWDYTISFIRQGVGKKITRPKRARSPINPTTSRAKTKGKSQRFFITNNNYRTLRSLAAKLYHDPNKWRALYNKNENVLQGIAPMHQLPTKLLPIGLKIRY